MSVSTLLRFVVTAKPKAQPAALHFAVQSRRAGIADFLHFTLNLTVALAGALLTSFRCLGIGIDLDRGDGVMSRVFYSELGPQATVTINGSLNNVGRSMTLQRIGRDQSPFLSSFLRSPRRITATGYLGVPGSTQSRPLFDGFLLVGNFDGYPSTASITAQDVSAKYSQLRLNYNLAPGSLRTRLSIILEILNANPIPYSTIDLGPDEGGIIAKPISVGGDLLLDWLSRFVVPIGRKLYFRPDGKMEIARFDTNGPLQRTLEATDVFSVRVTPPATNEANAVSFASTVFAYIGQSGTHTVVTDEATPGSYTPLVAVNKQDHVSGNVTAAGLAAPAASTTTKRVRTITEFNGGTIVAQIIEEWGFYAPRACNKWQDLAGAISWNPTFDVWQFPDGTWRTDPVETFQKIRETRIQRKFDPASGVITLERKDLDRYVAIELPLTIFSTLSVESSIAGFLTDDGRCWWAGREIVEFAKPDTSYEPHSRFTSGTEMTLTFFNQDAQGNIQSTIARTYSVGNSDYWFTIKPTGVIPAGTYFGFGPKDAKRYTIFIVNNVSDPNAGFFQQVGPTVQTVYTQLNETTYKETVSIVAGPTGSIEGLRMEAWQIIPGSVTKPGHVPPIEILTAKQVPQATTQVVTDEVRKALFFGTAITDYQGNDFCETSGELQTAAFERLRELSAFRVDIEMPIDLSLQEGKTFGISIPEITGDAKKCFVHDITMNFGPNGDGRQSVTAFYYPPELAAA